MSYNSLKFIAITKPMFCHPSFFSVLRTIDIVSKKSSVNKFWIIGQLSNGPTTDYATDLLQYRIFKWIENHRWTRIDISRKSFIILYNLFYSLFWKKGLYGVLKTLKFVRPSQSETCFSIFHLFDALKKHYHRLSMVRNPSPRSDIPSPMKRLAVSVGAERRRRTTRR